MSPARFACKALLPPSRVEDVFADRDTSWRPMGAARGQPVYQVRAVCCDGARWARWLAAVGARVGGKRARLSRHTRRKLGVAFVPARGLSDWEPRSAGSRATTQLSGMDRFMLHLQACS